MLVRGFGSTILKLHSVGQHSDDHIDDYPHQRPQSGFVVGLGDDVQTHRVNVVHEVADPEIAPARVSGDRGIAIEVKISLGR